MLNINSEFFYRVFTVLIIFAAAYGISAQGSAPGRKDSPTLTSVQKPKKIQPASKSVVNKSESTKKTAANKPDAPGKKSPARKPEKVLTATLEVTVDQSQSGITVNRIQNGNETNASSWTTSSADEPVSFNPLDAGDYVIKIQKPGFFDEQKRITLKAGKTAAVNITLRPSAGVLAVGSDADDAQIEIKTIGTFSGQIKKLVPAPQTYEVSVSADGYEPVTQTVKVELGRTTIVNANLKLIAAEKLVQIAENNYRNGDYKQTIANCRLILEQNGDEPRANLLMAYAYFYSERPRENRFYMARALALQTEVELPIKIYQKDKNSETLTDGMLKINRTNLNFTSAKRPELNFSVAPSSIGKLEINQDKNNSGKTLPTKPDSIEIKAAVNTGQITMCHKQPF